VKILVTSGATREPLDDVRFLSNVSTGATGAALADALAAHGHQVALLRGTGAVAAKRAQPAGEFGSTADLLAQLRALVGTGQFGAVIHCAAVADYTPARVARGKMPSSARSLTVRLIPTPKILPQIKSFAAALASPARPVRSGSSLLPTPRSPSHRAPVVIAFKLTSGADAAARATAVSQLFASGTVDAAIHNDTTDLAAGRARPFRAFVACRTRPQKLAGLPALAAWLDKFLRKGGAAGSAAFAPDCRSRPNFRRGALPLGHARSATRAAQFQPE